jgi:protein-tyrosine-phosphatase
MPSILFVCSANQCRSPMAEALFKSILDEAELADAWCVESTGVWAYPGERATPSARRVLRERGMDIENHRSRPVTEGLLSQFDLVLVMEGRHAEVLQNQYPAYADRVKLFSALVGRSDDIDDPVTGTLDTYRAAADELEVMLRRGFDRILEWTTARE